MGEPVVFSAEILNVGNGVGTFESLFFEVDGVLHWGRYTPIVLGPGQSGTVQATVAWIPQQDTSYQIRAVGANPADPPGNKVFERTLAVNPNLPDFVITSVTTPALADPNGSIPIDYTIQNQGYVSGQNVEIGLRANPATCDEGNPIVSDFIAELGSQQSLCRTIFLPMDAAYRELTVCLNANEGGIPELDSMNNCVCGSQTIQVRRPDLRITDVALSQDLLTPAISNIEIDFTVDNGQCYGPLSGWPAGASQVRFYLSPSGAIAPDPSTVLALTARVGPIAAETPVQLSTVLTLPPGFPLGDYYLHLEADGLDQVNECEEANNFHGTPSFLQVVDVCTLADLNENGSVDVSDLIAILNGVVAVVQVGNAHLNLAASPAGYPELINMIDFFTAVPCWATKAKPPSGGGVLNGFTVRATGPGSYTVDVDIQGQVNTLETYVRLPAGFDVDQWQGWDPLGSGEVTNLAWGGLERLAANTHIGLIPENTSLNGVVATLSLSSLFNLDLSRLTPASGPELAGAGIAVQVVFADGSTAAAYQDFDYLDIPDAAFRAYLEIFFNLPPGSGIPRSMALGVTHLDLSNLGIQRLNGIEAFTDLTSLVVVQNLLSELPDLSGLGFLTVLDSGDNYIEPFPVLPAGIEVLSLAGNALSEIADLSAYLQLMILDLSENSLGALPPLQSLTQLRVLDVHNNLLSSLPYLPSSLDTLMAASNQIVPFPAFALSGGLSTGWETLDLAGNLIQDIRVLKNAPYQQQPSIDLSNNRIDERNCEDLDAIKERIVKEFDGTLVLQPQQGGNLICPN